MRVATLLFSLAGLPLVAGAALAATPLSETQMDRMTAGLEVVPPIICANCTQSSSSSASQNGVTMKTSGSGTGPGALFLITPLVPRVIGTVEPIVIVTMP